MMAHTFFGHISKPPSLPLTQSDYQMVAVATKVDEALAYAPELDGECFKSLDSNPV